ncbi:hypothetical protein [[Scytonema hofmanni] UTEX B 1581]|uniref:hypothetical protein n=1 Tax=[Scytonema hofmanni] UTEX B 1581 TaxID=379535 RepID=UPI00049756C8|nr:hypothetical protein [[Scytonema hofmanni] UTEX B 1581]
MKGGRTSGTWKSSSKWQHGETQTIRVPAALIPGILDYAVWLDEQNKSSFAQDAKGDFSCNLILQAIDKYIEWKRQSYHPNQHSRELNINTRAWDELRKFRAAVERGDMGIKSWVLENRGLVIFCQPPF